MKPRIKSVIWNIRKQKNHQPEQQEEKRAQRNEDCIRRLWDNVKHTNIYIIGMPEEKRKGKK